MSAASVQAIRSAIGLAAVLAMVSVMTSFTLSNQAAAPISVNLNSLELPWSSRHLLLSDADSAMEDGKVDGDGDGTALMSTQTADAKVKPLRILIFITTHLSPQHRGILETCWPVALNHSQILSQSDFLAFASRTDDEGNILNSTFAQHNLTIKDVPYLLKQHGAIEAMIMAIEQHWFDGYDWIVRINPDVMLRKDDWLLDTMQDDSVDGIFADCNNVKTGGRCQQKSGCINATLHTDFFAVRPRTLYQVNSENQTSLEILRLGRTARVPNTEHTTTLAFRHILEAGRDRWLPGAHPYTGCKIRPLGFSAVAHYHYKKRVEKAFSDCVKFYLNPEEQQKKGFCGCSSCTFDVLEENQWDEDRFMPTGTYYPNQAIQLARLFPGSGGPIITIATGGIDSTDSMKRHLSVGYDAVLVVSHFGGGFGFGKSRHSHCRNHSTRSTQYHGGSMVPGRKY